MGGGGQREGEQQPAAVKNVPSLLSGDTGMLSHQCRTVLAAMNGWGMESRSARGNPLLKSRLFDALCSTQTEVSVYGL